jgi:GDP-4-dehydro-6-deoxy-D-mannose reductase
MRVLITGITGFVGSHLADYISSVGGVEVHGIHRWRSSTELLRHHTDIVLHECDLRDPTSVRDVLDRVRPARIFHLAAQSFVPTSWIAPSETLTTNVLGQLHIFEAVRSLGFPTRIQIAGSSEEYGLVHPHESPITEDNPLRPLSPYAVSKVAQDMLAYQYHASYKMDVVRTRGFNHTGPRRPPVFVCSNFAYQIARIEAGKQEPVIETGDLSTVRDFTDVRDIVRAYWAALESGRPGAVYNVATGRGWKIADALEYLRGLSTAKVTVRKDPARMRPSDVPLLVGDASRFRADTGWEPTIPFEQTLRDLLEYWREQTRVEATRGTRSGMGRTAGVS